MASDYLPYTPLREICALALDEMGKSMHDMDRAYLFGMRAYAKIRQQFLAQPVTFRIPVLGNKTAPFPETCLSWSKIGILNSEGEIVTLKMNNGLTTWRDNNPNRIDKLANSDINNSIGSLAGVPWFTNYYTNGSYYNLFGVGPGLIQYSSCRVDDENRVVILPPDFPYSSIMFECIESPERGNDYMVESVATEAIISFIKAKFKMGTMEEFYGECIEARRALPGKRVTLQVLNQVLRESETMKLRS